MINGILILAGLLGSLDNILVHWILGLHRLIEDSPYTLHAEIGLVLVSAALLIVGLWRELKARRGGNQVFAETSFARDMDDQ